MKPSIGRIVIYKTVQHSVESHNSAAELPAIIIRVWSDTCVNLKILGDGPHDHWRTSIVLGDQPNNWSWPERV